MAKASPLQSSFSGGEFSPSVRGRVDSDRYRTGLKRCLNFVPTIVGPLVRRPGSHMVEEAKTASTPARLIRFVFSRTQAYVLEFGDEYVRFFRNNARIESAGVPVEVITPYAAEDLARLYFTQSADVLYLFHPNYAPRKLVRNSDTNWTLSVIDFLDGPYLPENQTSTKLTPSATTGSVTITASSTTGINGDSGFQSTDVGRRIRILAAGSWTWYEITARNSATEVTATVRGAAGGTAGVTTWRLGLWSDTTGYPSCGTFHEDRLVLGGGVLEDPQRLDMSCSSDYENFAPTASDGDVADDNAVSINLQSQDINELQWVASQERGLLAGTTAGEWLVTPSLESLRISPTNKKAVKVTNYGSAPIQPALSGKNVLYVQRSGRKVREMGFEFEEDGFRSPDRTLLADHILGQGLTEVSFQTEPHPMMWGVRQDGALVGMLYERDVDALVVGWSEHRLGGYGVDGSSSAQVGFAKVVSHTVIPSPDGTRDEVWLMVDRTINGTKKRYIEYIGKYFDNLDDDHDAFFVDSGLSLDDPKTVTAITSASPPVVTAAGHGFSNGDEVIFYSTLGRNSDGEDVEHDVTNEIYTVAGATTDTFALHRNGEAVDGTDFVTFLDDGNAEVHKLNTTFSGLDHLEGETVQILADGGTRPPQTVSGGQITLDAPAAVVHIGLGYNSDAQMLRIEAGAADGTALGKTRRVHRVAFLLERSLHLKIGTNFSDLRSITFLTAADKMSRAVPYFSGVKSELLNSTYDFENEIAWRQDRPLPTTILAVAPQLKTEDRN